MSRRRTTRVLPVLLAFAATAACGSTVAPAAGTPAATDDGLTAPQAVSPGVGGQPLAVGAPTGPLGPVARSSTSATGAAIGDDGSGPAAAVTDPSQSQVGQATTTAGSASGPVSIGFFIQKNSDGFYQSTGVNASSGDHEPMVRAIVADLNSRGGLAGRRVEPVFFAVDIASAQSGDEQAQAACERFFQDSKVTAVVSGTQVKGPLLACAGAKGAPLVQGAPLPHHTNTFRRHPLFAASATAAIDRLWDVVVARLQAQQYFTAEEPATAVKTGVVHFDGRDDESAVRESLEPALRKRGLRLDARAAVQTPQRSSDLGSLTTELQNVVLRFRSEGVNRVLFQDYSGQLGLLFMQSAEAQGYRPRYGLTTYSLPTALLASTAPRAQLAGAVGVGWSPNSDVAGARDPAAPPARKKCLELGRAAGQNVANRTVALFLFGYCDATWTLERALATGGGVSAPAFTRGVDRLGRTSDSAATLGLDFGSGHHDGVGTVADLGWVSSCNCFAYGSGRAEI